LSTTLPDPDEDDEVGASEDPPDEVDAYRMTLLEHLTELRQRLIRTFIGIGVAVGLTLPFGSEIYALLAAPAAPHFPEGSNFIFTKPAEKFIVDIKVSLFAALLLSLPIIFYQMWQFVAPGLYKRERGLVLPFVFFSSVFFGVGATFCYLTVLPWAMHFFLGFGTETVVPQITVSEYMSFATRLIFAFGTVFQLPLVIFFLSRIGIVTATGLAKFRRFAIPLIFLTSAVLTPPDVVTQIALSLPLILLYELGIITAKIWGKPKPGADVSSP
jgi:sec-independent protein translocase protein TatC